VQAVARSDRQWRDDDALAAAKQAALVEESLATQQRFDP
jgi:hypothetical protein